MHSPVVSFYVGVLPTVRRRGASLRQPFVAPIFFYYEDNVELERGNDQYGVGGVGCRPNILCFQMGDRQLS